MSDNNSKSDQHSRYAERLKNYSLMDDVFFRAFIRDNKPAAELIFKIILQKDAVEITDMETQRDMKSLTGRSAAFDFYGKVDGKPADLEIENSVEGADFHCSDPEKMHYDILKEKARFLKETEKGVAIMYNDMDELEREGYNRNKKETAERMIRKGTYPDAEIADISGLSLSQVKALRKEMETTVMA